MLEGEGIVANLLFDNRGTLLGVGHLENGVCALWDAEQYQKIVSWPANGGVEFLAGTLPIAKHFSHGTLLVWGLGEQGRPVATSTGEGAGAALISSTRLLAPYPNPVNGVVTIPYQLAAPNQVLLSFYNTLGQKVRQLRSGVEPAGTYTMVWDGTDQQGKPVASGVYVCRLRVGDQYDVRRVLLLR